MKTKEFGDLYNITKNPILVNVLENTIYTYAEALSNGKYKGGSWISTKIEDEETKTDFWYFKLDEENEFEVDNNMRQKTEIVSSVCFSLIVNQFAFNHFINTYYSRLSEEFEEELYNLFYGMKNNASLVLNQSELKIFFQVID